MSARPKKHLGQHFLHDRDVIERIVHAIDPKPQQHLVEIGPGEGVLTLPLLDIAGKLTAIELDRDLHEPLLARCASHGELRLVRGDVLDIDLGALQQTVVAESGHPGQLRVVGNLPYYLSSPILFHCLKYIDSIADMHFMLQREVAERIAATPGGKVYGRLSVMMQLAFAVEPLISVPATAFRPPPKVESQVLRLRPLPLAARPTVDPTRLRDVVRAAFGQRRKTLNNALRGVLDADTIRSVGVDPKARAETLEPRQFVALTVAAGHTD